MCKDQHVVHNPNGGWNVKGKKIKGLLCIRIIRKTLKFDFWILKIHANTLYSLINED